MACVLCSDLDDSVPPSSRCPSPPYRGSSSAAPAEIAPIEEGDSRDSVLSSSLFPVPCCGYFYKFVLSSVPRYDNYPVRVTSYSGIPLLVSSTEQN